MNLVTLLVSKQCELGLSDRGFARRLHISQPLWSNVKKGLWPVGPKLMRAALREFPTMADLPDAVLKQMVSQG